MEMDTASKRLFALPHTVEHAVRAVAPDLARHLDFTDMIALPTNWTRPEDDDDSEGAQRYGDVAWRIPYAGDSVRSLLLLIEVQSSVDRRMVYRTQNYLGLLHDRLRSQGRLDSDGEARMLAVVVYTGRRRWTTEGGADAVPVLADGTPHMKAGRFYRLLDLRRLPLDDATMRNPALAVLSIAAVATPDEAAARVREVAARLPELVPDEEVRWEFRAAARAWVSAMVAQLFPDLAAGKVEAITRGWFEGEEEGSGMFSWADTVRDWEEHAQLVGFERGIAQGIVRERALLREQAEIKFGAAVGEELARRLEPVSDTGKLREAGALIIRCADGAELLARVRPNGAG